MHSGEKSSKCNQCDFASSQASNLRRHFKTHSGGCRRFEEAFENTLWRKVKQMQQFYFASSHAGYLRGDQKKCN